MALAITTAREAVGHHTATNPMCAPNVCAPPVWQWCAECVRKRLMSGSAGVMCARVRSHRVASQALVGRAPTSNEGRGGRVACWSWQIFHHNFVFTPYVGTQGLCRSCGLCHLRHEGLNFTMYGCVDFFVCFVGVGTGTASGVGDGGACGGEPRDTSYHSLTISLYRLTAYLSRRSPHLGRADPNYMYPTTEQPPRSGSGAGSRNRARSTTQTCMYLLLLNCHPALSPA